MLRPSLSRKAAPAFTLLAATALTLIASPAHAGPFGLGRKKPEPVKEEVKAAPPAPPRKATTEERALVNRQPPLARAAFWAEEVRKDPRDSNAGVEFSAALRGMGKHAEAIGAAEAVLALKPDHVDALLELARSHVARGQPFYAIAPTRQAQLLAPRDWRAPSLLGVAYEAVDRTPEARAAWEQALQLSPDNAAVLANLAMSWAGSGDLPRAEGLLRRAAARPDAGVKVRQNLALVLGLQGKTAEAERLIRDDLPPEQAAANLAWLRSAAGAGAGRSWDGMKGGR
jgi:Flp pilus assembly protein TadD